MSPLTIAWSMCAAACLMLGLMHLLLWLKDRPSRVYLLSSLMAFSAGASAMTELALLTCTALERYRILLQYQNLVVFFLLTTMVWFVYAHFKTARFWLAVAITVLWCAVIVVNFRSPYSVVYATIVELRQLPTFWGEHFTVAIGPANPWVHVANLASLLIVIYFIDASVGAWRKGNRHRAAVVGGSMVVFIVSAGIHSPLVDAGVIATPYMVSFAFLAIVLAMSYELVSAAVQVSRYARRIEADEERWRTLLENVQLAVIGIGVQGRLNYINPFLETLSGYQAAALLGRPVSDLIMEPEPGELDYRLKQAAAVGPRPHSRWTLRCASGERRELAWSTVGLRDADGAYAGLLSIGEDMTERLRAQRELRQTQRELEHLTRASILGELSSALAHELSQPLAAMLSNAQAARRFLAFEPPDLGEVRDILDDIIRDDQRAGQVVHRLRAMLHKGEVKTETFRLDEAAREVIELLHGELIGQHIALQSELSDSLPAVRAGRVEMQQVIMNLLHNAMRALVARESGARRIVIRAIPRGGTVEMAIEDNGPGIPASALGRIFEPFYTTSDSGLGMGLTICQRIVEAYGGWIGAQNLAIGGARFTFTVPVAIPHRQAANE